MNIQLTNRIRIISDNKNYIIQIKNFLETDSKKKKAGELSEWKDWGYYSNWEGMTADAIELKIRLSDAQTLKQVANDLKEIKIAKIKE